MLTPTQSRGARGPDTMRASWAVRPREALAAIVGEGGVRMADALFDSDAVIAKNEAARQELSRALEDIPPDVLRTRAIGEWSVADVLAHLAGAQSGYAEALECIARGEPPRITDYGPAGPPDGWNHRVVAAARERTHEELLERLAAAAERHVRAIRTVPPDIYAAPEPGFPNQFSRAPNHAQHYADSARHERQHVQAVAAWRRVGSDAAPD